jgi:hypothetical protein
VVHSFRAASTENVPPASGTVNVTLVRDVAQLVTHVRVGVAASRRATTEVTLGPELGHAVRVSVPGATNGDGTAYTTSVVTVVPAAFVSDHAKWATTVPV